MKGFDQARGDEESMQPKAHGPDPPGPRKTWAPTAVTRLGGPAVFFVTF